MKDLFLFLIAFILLSSCTIRRNSENTVSVNIVENQNYAMMQLFEKTVDNNELEIQYLCNFGSGNGKILEIIEYEGITWVFRLHIQQFKIYFLSEEGSIVYDRPMVDNGIVIGELKLGDNINITQVAEAIKGNDFYTWLEIQTDLGLSGWVFFWKI
jgi:hypothetical protein